MSVLAPRTFPAHSNTCRYPRHGCSRTSRKPPGAPASGAALSSSDCIRSGTSTPTGPRSRDTTPRTLNTCTRILATAACGITALLTATSCISVSEKTRHVHTTRVERTALIISNERGRPTEASKKLNREELVRFLQSRGYLPEQYKLVDDPADADRMILITVENDGSFRIRSVLVNDSSRNRVLSSTYLSSGSAPIFLAGYSTGLVPCPNPRPIPGTPDHYNTLPDVYARSQSAPLLFRPAALRPGIIRAPIELPRPVPTDPSCPQRNLARSLPVPPPVYHAPPHPATRLSPIPKPPSPDSSPSPAASAGPIPASRLYR